MKLFALAASAVVTKADEGNGKVERMFSSTWQGRHILQPQTRANCSIYPLIRPASFASPTNIVGLNSATLAPVIPFNPIDRFSSLVLIVLLVFLHFTCCTISSIHGQLGSMRVLYDARLNSTKFSIRIIIRAESHGDLVLRNTIFHALTRP